MNSNVIKELFIIVLLFIVVIFTLGMLFFDSINVDVQKIDEVAKKETTDFDNLINEVDLNSNNEDVNVTKSVSREDLEKYRQENSYNTGKKNPFSGVSDIKEKANNENTSINNTNKDTNVQKEKTDNTKNNNVLDGKSVNKSVNNDSKNADDKSNSIINNDTDTIKEDTTGRFFENKSSK